MTTCTHTVTVHGIQEPCGSEAVAVLLDPTERTPYLVCPGHVRPPMQSLAAHDREVQAAALRDAAAAMAADPEVRDPLRLRSDWLRARADRIEKGKTP